jgi:hypothetical protein
MAEKGILGKCIKRSEIMKYIKPNIDHEWMEALRYREFEKMGKDGWKDIASNDYDITNYNKIKDVLKNVDLDFDTLEDEKKERFNKAFKKGKVEIPMVVKFGNNDYHLLGGNTRLAGLIGKGINPKLWVVDMTKKKEEVDETNELKGGKSDNKSLEDIAKKHDKKGYYHIQDMIKSLKKQLEMGMKVEMEHTDSEVKAKEIAMDHLWEDPSYYTKLKKVEAKETDASSSGSFSGPVFGKSNVVKRPISSIPNLNLSEEEELKEVTAGDAGQFDVPAFGKTTKGGRKNPLKIDGPKSIYKGRAVTDKNFPKWGGPDSVFVKINEKCKKFPYCNQGDKGAIEFIHEDDELQESIKEISKKYGIPHKDVENIVLNEINKIFI